MAHRISKFFVMLAMALAMGGAAAPPVPAGPCGDQPCEQAEPRELPSGLDDRGSFERDGDVFQSRKQQRRAERNRKRQRRHQEIYSLPGSDDDEGRYVQYDDQDQNQGLIGETEALTQAMAAIPGGKPLSVKLLKGSTPMYAVKLRVRGKVRRIFVDARTAQILGE
jgi:uncharacterized membrane protein YkoI